MFRIILFKIRHEVTDNRLSKRLRFQGKFKICREDSEMNFV